MEDETVEEMMQEELVWRSEMERYTSDLYSLSDEAFAVGGAPRDDQLDRGGKFSKEFDYNQITIWLYTVLLLLIKQFFLLYKTVFKEEEYNDPNIDVSDIFDGDDEGDQNKKPRAKGYPSGTITIYSQEDKDEHRKCKADEQLLD